MNLERTPNALFLKITEDFGISFRDEWVRHLRTLPYDRFGDFMRGTVYKTLSDQERKVWHRLKISNKDLFNAVQNFE
ncbi:MAG: hypothetical protein JXA71_08225 [Chitinispirillaceae bacterium]|nr:hypothetical protein [Chitinispirillaceae bacterium]